MRISLVIDITFSVALVVGLILPPPETTALNNSLLDFKVHNPPVQSPQLAGDGQPPHSYIPWQPVDINIVWPKAACKGQKLLLGTTLESQYAAVHITPIDSPWDGTLIHEMSIWGYKDRSEEDPHGDFDKDGRRRDPTPDLCDFDNWHELGRAFRDLRIDPRSTWEGGPNKCFHYEHENGGAVERKPDGSLPDPHDQYYSVDGRRYRVTGAYYTIGVNAYAGIIYFISRRSPVTAAKDLWSLQENPPNNEMPALRASSDIAWGLWNRMTPGSLRNIYAFMSLTIVNQDTLAIVQKATGGGGVQPWPGQIFQSPSEEYLALLGSPNGIAAGFFLAQHKRQLGLKYIPKIRVFRSDVGGLPNIIFEVADVNWTPPKPPPQGDLDGVLSNGTSGIAEPRVVRRSDGGRNVIREHVVRAKL